MAETRPLPIDRDQPGNIKATREDWLAVAMDVLVSDGVEQVKVLGLSERLDVSRSSFYWYFKSRQDLLDQLLAAWEAKKHWRDRFAMRDSLDHDLRGGLQPVPLLRARRTF